MQLVEFLDKGADQFPDRDVVHDTEHGISYREMQALTCRLARAMHRFGLGNDDHVGGYSPNHPMAFAAQYGTLRSGAVWIPINARNSRAENAAVIQALDISFLFFHSNFEAEVREALRQLPQIRGCVCIDKALVGIPSLEQFCSSESGDLILPDKGPHDVVSMLTTSGTTGVPKGVLLTNLVWETTIATHMLLMPHRGPPVNVVSAPMTHAAGTYAASMLSLGVTNVLLSMPDPLTIMWAVDRFKGTTMFLPPTLVYMMLAHPRIREFDFSSLQYLFYGAAPMSPAKLREALEVFGNVMNQGFGQSEAPLLTVLTPQHHADALSSPDRLGTLQSAGKEGPLARVEIMGDDGRLLPRGEQGEIVVRSNMVMKGYYKNEASTREVSAHGWHHTGDVGIKDKDGFIYIVDRKKDMIITGGFNVFPAEVEKVLLQHESVMECAVVGVPDDKWGEAVLAAVELKPQSSATQEELIRFVRERLSGVKTPKRVEFVERLPRTATGKVLRKDIRARYWNGVSRSI
jgi:acyl-CoA synthetase (AMP-forming)/AMP-acid ligase II